jgi:hypothetical protein
MQWFLLIVALFWLVPLSLVLIGGIGCAVSHSVRTKLMFEFFAEPARPVCVPVLSKPDASGG